MNFFAVQDFHTHTHRGQPLEEGQVPGRFVGGQVAADQAEVEGVCSLQVYIAAVQVVVFHTASAKTVSDLERAM